MNYVNDIESVVVHVYIVLFVLPILGLLFFGWLILKYTLKNRKQKIVNDGMHEVKKTKKKDSLLSVICVWLVYDFIILVTSLAFLVPLALDMPYAINKNYYEADVIVTEDYFVYQHRSPHSSRSIHVKTIDGQEEFSFLYFSPSVDLTEGQLLHVKLLPHTRFGSYAIYE